MRHLLILTLALSLSGCGTPKGSIASSDLPPSLVARCDKPVVLPERDLTRSEVTRWWAQDRAALVRCGSQVAGIAG